MTVHRPHPIYDPDQATEWGLDKPDPYGAVLYDQCERCAQHAAQLTSLDGGNRKALLYKLRPVRGRHYQPTDIEQTVDVAALEALIELSEAR